MAFTPSLAVDLHVSLISLAVAVVAYFLVRARRRTVAGEQAAS
jgi:hypothetical protein